MNPVEPRPMRDMTQPELRAHCNRLARVVKSMIAPGEMFTILLFDDSQIGQYVSNAERGSMIKVLRETADRIEAREDVTR